MAANHFFSSLPSFPDLNRNLSADSFQPRLVFADGLFSPPKSPCPPSTKPILRNPISIIRVPFSRSLHQSNPSRIPRSALSRPLCYRCGVRGHLARSCLVPVRCHFCSGFGHKRARCFKRANPSSHSSRSVQLGHAAWFPQENQCFVPTDLRDPLLLDPDVAKYGDGFLEQSFSNSPAQPRPTLGDLQNQILIPRGLRSVFCISSTGIRGSRKIPDMVKDLLAPVLLRNSKGVKRCRLFGKGKGLSFSVRPWSRFGLANPMGAANRHMAEACSEPRHLAFEAVKAPVLTSVQENAIFVEESLSSDEDLSPYCHRSPSSSSSLKQMDLDLAPVLLEEFQDFEILDDFEDCCSDDDPALKSSSVVIDANLPKDSYPLKPSAIPMIPKGSTKLVSPAMVRRSPRLNKALF